MSLTKVYAKYFTSPVRQRGEAYFKANAVEITDTDVGYVAGEVNGTDVYAVSIDWSDADDPDDVFVCSCPYYADHGPCKHLWALVLQADRRGVLPDPGPAEVDSTEVLERFVADPAQALRQMLSGGGPFPIAALSELGRAYGGRGGAKPAAKPAAKSAEDEKWVNQLARLSEAMRHDAPTVAKPLSWPAGRRLLYVIDAAAVRNSGLSIRLMQETLKREGVYEPAKSIRLFQSQIAQLPDPADRQVIQFLVGAGKERYNYGYYNYDNPIPEAFGVEPSATEDVLKAICQTGRCRIRPVEESRLLPVTWDDGPTWEFCLHVQPSPGGRYLVLGGRLKRPAVVVPPESAEPPNGPASDGRSDLPANGDGSALQEPTQGHGVGLNGKSVPTSEPHPTDATYPPEQGADVIPLNQPHVLLNGSPNGFVFLYDTVARLQHFNAFPLISALRAGEKISVPVDRQADLLKMLLKFPRLPKLDLPPELAINEISTTPRPKIRISAEGKNAVVADTLLATVAFLYNDVEIKSDEKLAAVVTGDGHTLVRRDAQAEARHLADLQAIGLKNDFYQPGYRLPAKKLPKVVGDLTRKGWTVEADGKLYRSAGQMNIAVASGIDWFELHGEVSFDGGLTASLPRLLEALRKGQNVVQLDDGTFGLLPEEWLRKYGGLAGMGEAEGNTLKFTTRQIGFLDALLSAMPEARVDEQFAQARNELMRFNGIDAIDPPQTFTGVLRQYQREGLGWAGFLRKFGFGGILADDMGLGKTVQVLALLESRRQERLQASPDRDDKSRDREGAVDSAGVDSQHGHSTHPLPDGHGSSTPTPVRGAVRHRPSLVVAPRSLIFNWKSEAEKFAPNLRVLDHTAVDRPRSADHFKDYDLILTTYGTLRRDMAYFKDVTFDYAVLDEAQAIKNSASESAKAARLLAADHRLALSGTPVQNHLGELWSLFDYLNPGMMGNVGVFRDLSADAANKDATARELLARSLRPFILRRTKEQVAKDLPEKTEQTIFCELEKDQRKLYDELREHYRTSLLDRVARDGMNKAKIMVLEALLRLRQAACHPGLIDKSRTAEPSAKLESLMGHLEEILDEGHKVLVFSQFTSLLAIVKARLDKQKAVYEYLDGRTKDRQARVDRFQNDPDCKLFLISLKAGGVGLNLTKAEYVFLLDPWWNPAVEAQAIDRAHRIGQTERVFAYRLIAKDTVEEKVLQLQQSKKDLADAIINADNSLIRGLSREDLEMLLS